MQKKLFSVSFFVLSSLAMMAEGPAVLDTVMPTQKLEEVIVSSTRTGALGGLTVAQVTAEQLASDNNGVNLPFLLQMTPSLVVTSDDGLGIGYTYFRLRGTDHTRINMTVNGVPLNDSESQTVFWVNLTDMASSMNSVEVQRGIGSSTNGAAAFGASVNMQTSVATPAPYTELTFNGGMYNTFREVVKVGTGLLGNGFAFDARFSKVNSDGYLERAKSDLYSYYFSGGYYGEKTMVKLLVFGGKERTYMAWDGIDAETWATNPRYNPAGKYSDDAGNDAFYKDQVDNYQQQHTQLHFSHLFSSHWNMTAALHYTRGKGYYEQYKTDAKFASYGLDNFTDNDGELIERSDLVRQKHLDNHFFGAVAAVNYETEKLQATFGGGVNQYLGGHFGRILWLRNYPVALDKDHEYYRSQGNKLDANLYLKANWNITKELSVYGDLQYRHIDYSITGLNDEDRQEMKLSVPFNFFNPKAGLIYEKDNHLAYAKFAVANREPSRSNYTESGVNDHPLAERLYDYEVGYNFRHKRFSVGANLYFMDYDNQLVLTGQYSDVGAYLTKNVKDSYRLGIELVGGVQILKWLRWDGNVTLSRNKIVGFTDWVDDWNADWSDPNVAAHGGQVEVSYGTTDISFSPSVTAASDLQFEIKGFKASLQTNVVGRQYLDNTMNEAAMLKAYSVSNLNLAYTLPIKKAVKALTFRLMLNNLFNAKYLSNGGAYGYFNEANASTPLSRDNQQYTPWYYAQAGFNVHTGFTVAF